MKLQTLDAHICTSGLNTYGTSAVVFAFSVPPPHRRLLHERHVFFPPLFLCHSLLLLYDTSYFEVFVLFTDRVYFFLSLSENSRALITASLTHYTHDIEVTNCMCLSCTEHIMVMHAQQCVDQIDRRVSYDTHVRSCVSVCNLSSPFIIPPSTTRLQHGSQ